MTKNVTSSDLAQDQFSEKIKKEKVVNYQLSDGYRYRSIPEYICQLDIPFAAMLLYGKISALANQRGYCWATNEFLAESLRCSDRYVKKLLSILDDNGLVVIEIEDHYRRKIWLPEWYAIRGKTQHLEELNQRFTPQEQKFPGGRNKSSPIDNNLEKDTITTTLPPPSKKSPNQAKNGGGGFLKKGKEKTMQAVEERKHAPDPAGYLAYTDVMTGKQREIGMSQVRKTLCDYPNAIIEKTIAEFHKTSPDVGNILSYLTKIAKRLYDQRNRNKGGSNAPQSFKNNEAVPIHRDFESNKRRAKEVAENKKLGKAIVPRDKLVELKYAFGINPLSYNMSKIDFNHTLDRWKEDIFEQM